MFKKLFNSGFGVILVFLAYTGLFVFGWWKISMSFVAPWLTGMGLVEWASALASLVGIGFVAFWLWLIILMFTGAVLAASE